jgi:hypothetical protein
MAVTGEHMSDEPTYDPELTAERLRGLDASAACIRECIARNDRSEEQRDTVRRNCDHIGIACQYEDVQASGADLSDYWTAQREGHRWLV